MKMCSLVFMLLSGGTNRQNGEAIRSKMYHVIACYVINILYYSKEN